jgi:hypothetical protein
MNEPWYVFSRHGELPAYPGTASTSFTASTEFTSLNPGSDLMVRPLIYTTVMS